MIPPNTDRKPVGFPLRAALYLLLLIVVYTLLRLFFSFSS